MISASRIQAAIQAGVFNITEAETAQNNFADSLKSYLLANVEIIGTYAGTVSGAPDPLNNTYTWKLSEMTLQGSKLLAAAGNGFENWVAQLNTYLSTMKILGADQTNIITTTAPALILVSGSIDMQKKNDYDEAHDVLAQQIYDNIIAGIITPLSVAATSSGGGVGTTTFSVIQ